jgi:signal transduction histidine kinase
MDGSTERRVPSHGVEDGVFALPERLRQALFTRLWATSRDAVLLFDRDGHLSAANPAAASLFGSAASPTKRTPYHSREWGLREPSGAIASQGAFGFLRVLRTGEAVIEREWRCRHAELGERVLAVTAEPLGSVQRRVDAVLVRARDVTEARRAADEEARRERLRGLLREQQRAQEEERRRLARELHDGVGPLLATLRLLLPRLRAGAGDETAAVVGQAEELSGALTDQIRRLALDLRPAVLDDLGLLPALLWLAERFAQQSGLRVRVSHSGVASRRFSPEIETALFRIAQEALTNAARHGGAGEASLGVKLAGAVLSLYVSDAGIGFDLASRETGGIGLGSMRERAELLGGSLVVRSSPGRGTTVEAAVPLTAPEA